MQQNNVAQIQTSCDLVVMFIEAVIHHPFGFYNIFITH